MQQQIEWRRNQVLELSSKCHSGTEIAKILQVDKSLVSRDLLFLRQQAHHNLQRHIQDKLPEEYQRCLTGINQVLKLSWQIANANTNGQEDSNGNKTITTITEKEKIRLQAELLPMIDTNT